MERCARHHARTGGFALGRPAARGRGLALQYHLSARRKAAAWPKLFLFTDAQVPWPMLLAAIARLPRGAAVIFRHYDLDGRSALAEAIRTVCRRRGVRFIPADASGPQVRGNGLHRAAHLVRRGKPWPPGLRTAAAHGPRELARAAQAGAHLAFLSPVFPTASHPQARPLGRVRFGLMARAARLPVAALGGITPRRFASLQPLGAYAWGAVAAFLR